MKWFDDPEFQEWLNELMVNAGDEWDIDQAMTATAVDYVRWLETFKPNERTYVSQQIKERDEYRLKRAALETSLMTAENALTALRIPKDQALRDILADEAGLTDAERQAIDQWANDQQRERAQGIVPPDEAGRK